MSQRIRIGNTYEHTVHGEVLTIDKDHNNRVYFRCVTARDNAGVISLEGDVYDQPYDEFLGCVRMRDYPDEWSKKAAAIRERDSHTCQGCGVTENAELHVHHIVPLGAGGSNARSNLITLCDECHGRVHSGPT